MRYSENINSKNDHNPSIEFGFNNMRVQKNRQLG